MNKVVEPSEVAQQATALTVLDEFAGNKLCAAAQAPGPCIGPSPGTMRLVHALALPRCNPPLAMASARPHRVL